MSPDHYIDRAAAAIYASSAFGDKFAYDAWRDMDDDNPIKTTTRMYARAALEATAADIWDEGYEACTDDVSICTNWNTETPNPYKASEDA